MQNAEGDKVKLNAAKDRGPERWKKGRGEPSARPLRGKRKGKSSAQDRLPAGSENVPCTDVGTRREKGGSLTLVRLNGS